MFRVSLRINDDAHARVGPLAVNVNVERKITDAHIRDYMRATLEAARGNWARVSLSYFAHDVPNARQRQIIVDELKSHGAPAPDRTALLTDSAMMRGALTAFSWVIRSDTGAFSVIDRRKALVWLAERVPFDVGEGLEALEECFRVVGHPLVR
jgi:hypothetical protein